MKILTLDNGLKIGAHTVPSESFYHITLLVEAGACHEPDSMSGRAHFNEHMAFAGTESRSFNNINFAIKARGGELNASTHYQKTEYHISIPATYNGEDNLPIVLDILADIIQNSNYPEDRMRHEKGVILNEMGYRNDITNIKLFELAMRVAYPHQSYGRQIIGNKETVTSFTRENCLEFFRQHYRGGNIAIAITGPASADKLIEEVSKYFSSVSEGVTQFFSPPEFHSAEKRINSGEWLSQIHMSFAMPFAHGLIEEDEPLRYLTMRSLSHQIQDLLREKSNLSYGMSVQLEQFRQGGVFIITGDTTPETADDFLQSIGTTFQRAHRMEDISQEIFDGIKTGLLAYYERLPIQGSSLCDEILYCLRRSEEEFNIGRIVGQIKAITIDDLKDYAVQTIDPTRLSFVSMGPRTDFMSYDNIRGLFSTPVTSATPRVTLCHV